MLRLHRPYAWHLELDQETMVEANLTDDLILSGADLVRSLDESDLTIKAALWFYSSDVGAWRLILGVKEADKLGPKATYRKVQSVIQRLKKNQTSGRSVSLYDIAVVEANAPLLELLRVTVRTDEKISGIRFSNNAINGQLIEDAYIYRLL